MSNQVTPEQRDDALVLQEIVGQLEQASEDYKGVLVEVRAHQDQIVKESAALGSLRARLIGMREHARRCQKAVWKMGWNSGVTREALNNVRRAVNAYERLLDELIWELFEFREKADGEDNSVVGT